jgi:hypothetical protein
MRYPHGIMGVTPSAEYAIIVNVAVALVDSRTNGVSNVACGGMGLLLQS